MVTICGIVYQLSGQLPCYVNQSGITMEQKSSTAVSWCRRGCDWQAGKVVPPVFSKWAYWCPGYTFTSQRTSSPLGVHFHQLSPSPKWSAWKPPQQSEWQEYQECESTSELIRGLRRRDGIQRDIRHYLILLGWGLHECSTPGISKLLSLLWLDNPGKD